MHIADLVRHLISFSALLLLARLTSGLIGSIISYANDAELLGARTFVGFVRYCFPREVFKSPHVRLDVLLTLLNRFATVWVVLPILATLNFIVPLVDAGLGRVFGTHLPPQLSPHSA